jgi:hypothetical protein
VISDTPVGAQRLAPWCVKRGGALITGPVGPKISVHGQKLSPVVLAKTTIPDDPPDGGPGFIVQVRGIVDKPPCLTFGMRVTPPSDRATARQLLGMNIGRVREETIAFYFNATLFRAIAVVPIWASRRPNPPGPPPSQFC